jgi:DNA-binding NarL/FixJ family response regulator
MSAKASVLIVEDDWMVANGLREMLRSDGYVVVGIAARAEQVEPLLLERSPALALVDIDLGRGGDGVDVARDVLAPAGVRVVFTSAHADERTLERVGTARAAGFVVKPFSQKQLRAALQVALALAPSAGPANDELAAHVATARRALADLEGALAGAAPAAAAQREVAVRLRADTRLELLSVREHEVLRGLLVHHRVPAIAEQLEISAHTVRNHLKAIFAKLRVSSQQELLDQLIDREATAAVAASQAANQAATADAQSQRRIRVRPL